MSDLSHLLLPELRTQEILVCALLDLASVLAEPAEERMSE